MNFFQKLVLASRLTKKQALIERNQLKLMRAQKMLNELQSALDKSNPSTDRFAAALALELIELKKMYFAIAFGIKAHEKEFEELKQTAKNRH